MPRQASSGHCHEDIDGKAGDGPAEPGTRGGLPRRQFLRTGCGGLALLTGVNLAGVAAGQQRPYGGYLSNTSNFDGKTVDRRGQDEVSITVGASGNNGNFAFEPAAVVVDPGTTIRWQWTGEGGQHNVVAEDGAFESELTAEVGFTYERTVEQPGVLKYYCDPHRSLGMKGVVAVGDSAAAGDIVQPDAGGSDAGGSENRPPELSEPEWTFMLLLIATLGYGAIIGLLPDIIAGTHALNRRLRTKARGFHGTNDFRRRLVSSTVAGWLTVGIGLLTAGAGLVVLWQVTAGGPAFLVGLAALVVVSALYATTGIRTRERHHRPLTVGGSPGRWRSRNSSRSTGKQGNLAGPGTNPVSGVLRGLVAVSVLFGLGAIVAVGVWTLTGGGPGFLAGLGLVVLIAIGYTISSLR